MKVIVISSAPLVAKDGAYFAYSPYAKELEIWAKYADEIGFMCPVWETDRNLLIAPIPFSISKIFKAREFNLKGVSNVLRAIGDSISNFFLIFRAMAWADHIHLRCPGNMALIGCVVQIFFPSKSKTAKYAGNWDPKAKQPWSYQLQKWILSNTFLTKNMQVLVYGEWPGSSKNIKPFFTASYKESDKIAIEPRKLYGQISFVFVGMLATGKRPLYAVKLVERLCENGVDVVLDMYGEGNQKETIVKYISENNLSKIIRIHGNQPQSVLINAYQQSHFVILPSESEGWPKVVAEGMFWGCVPITTKISCLSYMLDGGNRGIFLDIDLEKDAEKIEVLLRNAAEYSRKLASGIIWSRKYTLDLFESEIKGLLNK